MSLGNNRDYQTTDRVTRKALKAHKERMDRIAASGVPTAEASKRAMRSASCDGKPEDCTAWIWLHTDPDDQKLWQTCLSVAYNADAKDPVGTAEKMYKVHGGTVGRAA
jgi:hypothetical protein